MMRVILIIIIFFLFIGDSYSSFPVDTVRNVEFQDELISDELINITNTPVFGILSIIFSIIALLILPSLLLDQLYLFFVFSISALVFGILGIRRKFKFLARIGFTFALLEIIVLLLLLLWTIDLGSGRKL